MPSANVMAVDIFKQPHHPCRAGIDVGGHLMFPEAHDLPARAAQQAAVPEIASPVAVDLGFPFLRQLVPPPREAPAMPEVAVNEDGHLLFAESKIRSTRKVARMTFPFEFRARSARQRPPVPGLYSCP